MESRKAGLTAPPNLQLDFRFTNVSEEGVDIRRRL